MPATIYTQVLENTEGHDYQYKRLDSGAEVVNVWEGGPGGTPVNGIDMPLDTFLAEYGLYYAVELAREDYSREYPLVVPPPEFDPQPVYTAVARANYETITAWIDDRLWQQGITLAATEYRDGRKDRYDEAWRLFERGSVQLPEAYGQAFTVQSSRGKGVSYKVYLGCVPGGRGWHCECRDYEGWASKDCGQVCKHTLAAMVGYCVLGMLAAEGRAALKEARKEAA